MPKVKKAIRRRTPDEILDAVKKEGALYAKKATQLSDMLERAEWALQELPAKIPVRMFESEIEESPWLAFERFGGDWRLVFHESELELYDVTSSNVNIKARAGTLLPDLYDLLINRIRENLSLVDGALEELENVPFLTGDAKEGDE
jgi:hypothetical protein